MSWPLKPLGEILELSGRNRAGEQNLPVLSITMKHGLVDQADKFKKRVASSDTSNYRVAYKNELVVGFPIDEGVLGFQTKYPEGIVSPAYDIWKLRNEADSHIYFLERYLRSAQARGSYASRMQGAVARRRSLTKTDFLNLEIPFPPLDDQIRIAHLLGKVEGLIAQRKQHLQQLDDLLKSVFLAMFGDPVRNEKEWETGTSSIYANLVTVGVVVKPASHYVEHGVIALRSLNIKPNRIDLSDLVYFSQKSSDGPLSKSRLRANDVVIVRTGKTGTAAVVPAALDGANCIDLIVVRPKPEKIHPQFLTSLLNSERGMALVSSLEVGGIQKHFNVGALNKIPFPLPPIPLQDQFADIVTGVEAIKSRYQQSLIDLEALYGALSQQAFKGELDLSRVALPAAPIEGESPVAAAVPAPIATPVIELPETELLLPALQDRTRLAPLLRFWLEAYCTQLGSEAFSVERFMVAVQTRMAEWHPDNDFEWAASDYESIKTWVFEALAAGSLTQAFDDDRNCIELKVTAEQIQE
jgi:type I restriction enzyme, S subunit